MGRKTRLPTAAPVVRAASPVKAHDPTEERSDDSTGSGGSSPAMAAVKDEATLLRYNATAHPEDLRTAKLHMMRYRDEEAVHAAAIPPCGEDREAYNEERRAHFRKVYETTEWKEEHRHLLEEMDVRKFTIDMRLQHLIYNIQTVLVDEMYERIGKSALSWGNGDRGYTLMFRNQSWNQSLKSSDERKPVTDLFQEWCEKVYCPVIWTLLFGKTAWTEELKPHFAQFKSCTIKICEDGMAYGDNVFHMHIDGKIGVLEPKNRTQRHMSRLLFSIVKGVMVGETDGIEDEAYIVKNFGATNYPIWQPRKGFKTNHEFHQYMRKWYHERGIENTGLPRPHYEIPENLLWRAMSGEVLLNRSHADPAYGCQPIHSEPNPCPDRHLFVFDWNNIIVGHEIDAQGKTVKLKAGQKATSLEIPEDRIIELMREGLMHADSVGCSERLAEVVGVMEDLVAELDLARYEGGREALERARAFVALLDR